MAGKERDSLEYVGDFMALRLKKIMESLRKIPFQSIKIRSELIL